MRIEDKFAQSEVLFNSKFQNIGSSKDNNEQTEAVSFGDVLKKAIDDTNGKMTSADVTATKFIKGEDVNIDEVMIKNQEASLSLQFLTQTRDKLLEGYNQLSRLQL
ncbi:MULTISPECIES: flagellar hook-basal body complex protein FliE [unclassified Clostridium]|uniref:flagellar hook-basal body complex protein FliE n=1 Tax=unclassified Clostridium TaxID=2614128 RepID=UPI00029767A4|nr:MULTISPECIES: flagellar hook-basal body complex protein FliE [unclassified Clostridium]EKQ51092.1 MAG: flagellar hook-basal body complex protein FliE [Clostridium sp. Maddingley MBC34-26]